MFISGYRVHAHTCRGRTVSTPCWEATQPNIKCSLGTRRQKKCAVSCVLLYLRAYGVTVLYDTCVYPFHYPGCGPGVGFWDEGRTERGGLVSSLPTDTPTHPHAHLCGWNTDQLPQSGPQMLSWVTAHVPPCQDTACNLGGTLSRAAYDALVCIAVFCVVGVLKSVCVTCASPCV